MHHRLEDESGVHVEMREQNCTARGSSPDEAARLARKPFGSTFRQQNNATAQDPFPSLDALRQDARRTAQRLGRSTFFLLSSILMLVIGVALNSAVFSVLNITGDRLYILSEFRDRKLSIPVSSSLPT